VRRGEVAAAVAVTLMLAACASPAEQARQQCSGAGPPGSAAYADCLRTAHERLLQREQQRLDEKRQLENRIRAGGDLGHPGA
jgi:hypothetical protein